MSPGRQLLLSYLVSLQLLHGGSARSNSAQFEAAALCPNVSALSGRSERSKIRCAAACGRDLSCDLFHFNRTSDLCYHGNSTCEGLALWNKGACDSYRAAVSSRPSTDPIVSQLDLKLLYRFATHDLGNVADPCRHRLWSGPATVQLDADGAHFVESLDSYLMAETTGFETVINKGNKFSLFVRAKHPLNIDGTYASFRHCTETSVSHDLYTDSSNTWHQVFWPADSKSHCSKSGDVFTKSSSVALVSTGVTYDTDHDASFFFNGSMHAATLDSNPGASNMNNANFQCLQLGGFPTDAKFSIRGSISCFALSTRLLTQHDFVLLDNWCQGI